MMKHLLNYSVLLVLILAHNSTTWGNNPEYLSTQKKEMLLVEAISLISRDYNVYFTFDHELVKDIVVEYESRPDRPVEEAISGVLSGTDLKFKLYDRRFVILYQNDEKGLESLQEMVKHFQHIIADGPERKAARRHFKPVNAIPLREAWVPPARKLQNLAINVSGTITDQAGEPLIGVNVQVKGTIKGAATDLDGHYELSDVNENAILVFSYVGYQTQGIPVDGRSTVDVTMLSDAQMLDEVVVVGYGTMKKNDLTGSVVIADHESFSQTANVNIIQSLQGTVAGLNVGAIVKQGQEPAISLRGLNTLGGSTSPLIVLDGTIFRGRVVDINPADIESVTILKDASAAAVYGSQSANGVIMITTKRGSATNKLILSYSGSVGFQSPTKFYTPMNREQFLEKNKDVWWRKAYLAPDYTKPDPTYKDVNALVRVDHVLGYNDGTDTDWEKEAVQTGMLNNHNLGLQTKGNNISSYISLGYTDSKGYVRNDDFERLSFRMNADNEVLDWVKIGIQSFASVSSYAGTDANLSSILSQPPLNKSHNEDGSLKIYPADFLTPLFYQKTDELNKYFSLYGNMYADIDIPFIDGLTYRLDASPNYRLRRYYTYNPFSQSEKGDAQKSYWNDFGYSIDQRLNYNRQIGIHFVDVTFAGGLEKRTNDYTRAYSGVFANQGLSYNRLQDGTIDKQLTTTQAWQESSTFQMVRVLYNYDERYLFTGTVRRDGFSGFGKNNKFGIFPSVALGWRISQEEFMRDQWSWLDQLKLRISYGENGNRSLGRYQTLAKMTSAFSYTFGGFEGGTSALSKSTSTLANPDLKWESTTSLNLGLDFAVINSRINGAFEYYFSKTHDMLYQVDLPIIGGIGSAFTNLGEIKNRGIELTINTINIKNQDFSWESDIAFSANRNKIITLLGKDDDGDGIEDDLVSSGLFIGEPISSIYYYNVLGLHQLGDDDIPSNSGPGLYKYEDINGDGIISPENDRKIIGYRDPSYRVSFMNKFSYKNFALIIFLNSIQGGKNHYYGAITGPTGGARDDNVRGANYGVEHSDYWWTPQNPGSPFKELFAYDPIGNVRYFQRNFVRLQDVSLSYRFNASLLERVQVQQLSVFISGKNLHTWTNWYGLDPELGQGFLTSAPLLKNFTFGINLTF